MMYSLPLALAASMREVSAIVIYIKLLLPLNPSYMSRFGNFLKFDIAYLERLQIVDKDIWHPKVIDEIQVYGI